MNRLILAGIQCITCIFIGGGTGFSEPALTIYNQGFALVRQDVSITLKDGESTVHFDEVTSQLEPDSVVLRDPKGQVSFQVLEQNYRNDPVSEALLLDQFVGEEIEFELTDQNNQVEIIRGRVLRSGYVRGGRPQDPIIEVDGKQRFGLPGKPLFPSLGDDSILKPTLSWQLLGTAEAQEELQLSYLSEGFSWKADYNLVVPEKGETGSLNGWVTLSNHSGAVFENATVKLLAGDVNKVQDFALADAADPFSADFGLRASVAKKVVTQKEMDSYHLYQVARPVTLRDQETKQVEFLTSSQVAAKKTYVYEPLKPRWNGGRQTNAGPKEGFPKDVEIYWSFENTKANGLEVPMPAGTIRLYREGDDGQLEFLGDNHLDHTPQKEEVEFYTGNAFDLVGERKMTHYQYHDREDWIKESIEIKVRNRSKEKVQIEVREPLYRWSNWEIEQSSHEFTKEDARMISTVVELTPDAEEVLTFTVKYWW